MLVLNNMSLLGLRLCLPSPQRALASLGLMLTCMYSGKSGVIPPISNLTHLEKDFAYVEVVYFFIRMFKFSGCRHILHITKYRLVEFQTN